MSRADLSRELWAARAAVDVAKTKAERDVATARLAAASEALRKLEVPQNSSPAGAALPTPTPVPSPTPAGQTPPKRKATRRKP
jgi:hypothetical protein